MKNYLALPKEEKAITNQRYLNLFLNEICTIIIANKDVTINSGLFNGAAGSQLFLYHLAKFLNSDVLSEIADSSVVDLTERLNESDLSFGTGLSGIGWMLSYLCHSDFLDIGSPDAFYGRIDDKLIRMGPYVNLRSDSIGTTMYFFNRIENATNKDIGYLLKVERIIAHVDKINSKLLLKKISKIEDFEATLDNPVELDNFFFVAHQIFNCAVVLEGAKSLDISSELVERIVDYYFTKSRLMLDICQLIISKLDSSVSSILLDKLETTFYKTYLLHLRLSSLISNCKSLPIAFYENTFIIKVDELRANIDVNKRLVPTIYLLASLLGIRYRLKSDIIELIIQKKVRNVLSNYTTQRFLIDGVKEGGAIVHIGLHGLAGLGLALLSSDSDESTAWVDALLISENYY